MIAESDSASSTVKERFPLILSDRVDSDMLSIFARLLREIPEATIFPLSRFVFTNPVQHPFHLKFEMIIAQNKKPVNIIFEIFF